MPQTALFRRWPVQIILLCLFGVTLQAVYPDTVVGSDVFIYEERMTALFAGQLPYIDFSFEQLPLSIAPMVAARLVSAPLEAVNYSGAFALLSTLTLLGIGAVLHRVGPEVGVDDAPRRWLIAAGALFPLLLYRVDAFSVLLVVLGLWGLVSGGRRLATGGLIAGVAAKGWPVVIAAAEWLSGRRRRAVVIGTFTVALTGLLLLTPGFREGRAFTGVHLETVSGSVTLLARLVLGREHGFVGTAGAYYVEVSWWAAVFNLILGSAFGLAFVTRFQRSGWQGYMWLAGGMTFAIMLASPLLSAQFMVWITPFVALLAPQHLVRMMGYISLVTITLLIFWQPPSALWALGLVIRNAMLLGLGVELLRLRPPARTAVALGGWSKIGYGRRPSA